MKKVLFYQKDTPKNQIELWDIKLKKWHKNFKLVYLDDPEAFEATIASMASYTALDSTRNFK